jgi:hypothetical protein
MLARMTRVALIVAGIVIALSVFIALVGLPSSEAIVTEQCAVGSPCAQTSTYSNTLTTTPVALVPLLTGMVVAAGLVKGRMVVSWIGTILLLVFSFFGLFSIGLLYMPLGIALVGLLAVLSSRAKISV